MHLSLIGFLEQSVLPFSIARSHSSVASLLASTSARSRRRSGQMVCRRRAGAYRAVREWHCSSRSMREPKGVAPPYPAACAVNSTFGWIGKYLQATVETFVADEALTRGAAIAFYTVTSIGPVLFIVVAIAGLAFGGDAARGAVSEQLSGLMGKDTAELVQKVRRL